MLTFRQVDVFGARPLGGNPVAVVHDAEGLPDRTLQDFARWTNLSETTFLLPPEDPRADYRLRIFTPEQELPFAGHPTIGSAHAWLEEGGQPADDEVVVQECGVGLVTLHRGGGRLAFEAPPLIRSGPVAEEDRQQILAALRVTAADVVELTWLDNGPGWVGVLLRDAEAVLALEPDRSAFGDLDIGVVGPRTGGDTACEVRAFCPGFGIPEDPVTGSLNAGIGMWLAGTVLPASYVAAQGSAVGRDGRVHVERVDGGVRVGGDATTVLHGSVGLAS